MHSPPLVEYPCTVPLKVIGNHEEQFAPVVLSIVQKHVPNIGEGDMACRQSSGGKYLSISITFTAESQEQLDALYRDLRSCEMITLVL